VFHTLRDAVAFYAERDTVPGKWYPGHIFDDLPVEYAGNVSHATPFGGERVLSDADIDDLVAFLRTLTDGFSENDAATAH
jgi:cytochrome c peroxidase